MNKIPLWAVLSASGLMAGGVVGVIMTGLWRSPLAYYSAAILALVVLGVCILAIKKVRRESIDMLRDPDAFQAAYYRGFRYFPWCVLLLGAANTLQMSLLWLQPHDQFMSVNAGASAALTFSVSGIYAHILSGRSQDPRVRRLLQDEFLQDNLAKARGNGFFAFLVAMPICFFAGLIDPLITISLLPISTGICVAVAGWQFNRRAEQAMAYDDSPER